VPTVQKLHYPKKANPQKAAALEVPRKSVASHTFCDHCTSLLPANTITLEALDPSSYSSELLL
jgi:hypothetical protein